MSYADSDSVEAGLRFKTRSGRTVETTGATTHIETNGVHVHEVVILDGPGEGDKFLHNLDKAEAL